MVDQIKVQKVNDLHDKFTNIKGAVLAEYRGLTVAQMTELRVLLKEKSGKFKIIKNTLAKKAAEGTPFENVIDSFTGPTSIAYSYDDALATAKIMTTFAKKEEKLVIKGGIVEGQVCDKKELAAIAELPSREVLIGKMLGSMNAPVTNFVGVMGGVLKQIVFVLNAIKEKKGGN